MLKRADPLKVEKLLLAQYGPYPAEDTSDLLGELVWFMLSTRTTAVLCERAFQALRKRFPTYSALLSAPLDSIAEPLTCTGFSHRRADSLQRSLALIHAAFGRLTLAPLKRMPVDQAEAFLLTLPGVGIKVARCFLQFGLKAPAFAVDTHIWRISQRIGWIPDQHGHPPAKKGMDALQALVPKDDTVSLHVNLIKLGRDFCTARETRCESCPLAPLCPSAKLVRPGR